MAISVSNTKQPHDDVGMKGRAAAAAIMTIFRSRATEERGSVYGQGLEKIRLDRGWGFAHFNDGKPADEAVHNTCFSCHQAVNARDSVFTHYAP
jgi:hypothetical protein